MSVIKGVVEVIRSRQVDTKYGTKPAYSAKVGEDWIDIGFKKPSFNKGDMIEAEVEGQYNKLKSVKVVGNGGSSGSNRDRVIVRQNALGHATQIALAKAPEDSTSSEVAEVVIKLAEKFEAWVLGD